MRRNFLVVNIGAAEIIISDRFLQSADFELGAELAEYLLGHRDSIDVNAGIQSVQSENGQYVLSRSPSGPQTLVIDLVNAPLFEDKSKEEALIIFQRLLRFTVRYWKHQRLGRNERIIQNSSKAIVFPFPISSQTSFRISMEDTKLTFIPCTMKKSMGNRSLW